MTIALAMLAAAALPPCGAAPIIDVHLHAYDRDKRIEARMPTPGSGRPNPATDMDGHRRLTAARASEADVVVGIISSGQSLAAAEAMVAAAPDRFRLAYQIDDVPTPEELAEIRALAKAGKLTSISEVDPQYEGVAPNDPRLEPLWALAEELQLPIGIHIGSGPANIHLMGSPKHRAAIGDPLLIEEVLVRHPKLKLFIMHAGFPFAERTQALLNSYPNVYVDLGAIHYTEYRPWFHSFLKRMIEGGFADRVMFGSDQMAWPDAIPLAIEAYREADYLTEAQKRGIFFDNALKFFGWKRGDVCRG